MNAPDMHMATLAHQDRAEAYRECKYREMLDDAFESVIADGDALKVFDSNSEAIYSSADLVARLLWAYRRGHRLLGFVEALHDAVKQKHEAFYGEEIRERAEAAILAGNDDD